MKQAIDITLQTLHVGESRRVVTLGIDHEDPAFDFLSKLKTDDSNKYDSIESRIKAISKYEHYENKITFRHVGDGIYEFKRPGVRLYAFYDEIEGLDHLILCTNGGKKNKRQNSDILKAKGIKKQYLLAKQLPDTILHLKDLNE